MNTSLIIRIVIVLGIYFFLRYLGGWIGEIILYPITLLVTYLHEFGHASAALISGGKPLSVQVNLDGSGFTLTQGGWENFILMGGYLGSIIFGNIMLAISIRWSRISRFVLKFLAVSMAVTAVVWHSNLSTSGMLILFSAILYFAAEKTEQQSEILMLLGILCIAYILQDFKVGPSSDIQKFASNTFINSQTIWMFIWAIVACAITFLNVRYLLWKKQNTVLTQQTTVENQK